MTTKYYALDQNKIRYMKILELQMNNLGIKFENYLDRPGEIFELQDVYISYYEDNMWIFTKDLKVLDISNKYFSIPKFIFLGNRKYYENLISHIKILKDQIMQKNYIELETPSNINVSCQYNLPIHNMEDIITCVENSLDYKINNKEVNLQHVSFRTDNFYGMEFLKRNELFYSDVGLKFKLLEMGNIYKFNKCFVSKRHHNLIYNLDKQKSFTNFLNRMIRYYQNEYAYGKEIQSSIFLVKVSDVKNGTNFDNRCVSMDNIDLVLKEYNITNLNKIIDLQEIEYHVINCEFAILSWGSNMYINMKLYNYGCGKKFIVLITSGYLNEFNRFKDGLYNIVPFANLIGNPLRYSVLNRKKIINDINDINILKKSSDNKYIFYDNEYCGNFVRYVYQENSNHYTNDLMQTILSDYEKNFPFNEIADKVKKIIKNQYNFLTDAPEYNKYVQKIRIVLLWEKIGYSFINCYPGIENMNLDDIYNNKISTKNIIKNFEPHTLFVSAVIQSCDLCDQYYIDLYNWERVLPCDFNINKYRDINSVETIHLSDKEIIIHFFKYAIPENRKYKN